MSLNAAPQPVHVTVWAADAGPRLRYVLDWLLVERLGLSYELTTRPEPVQQSPTGLAYGWLEGPPSIHDGGLLREQGIRSLKPVLDEWEGLQVPFLDAESTCDIQFDMLGGIFFLLSRYEEYLPFTADRHNRYPAADSMLFAFLERPVVDEWVESLRRFLEQVWQISIPVKPFSFEASYDIDIAWKYANKGWMRSLGAAIRDLLHGRVSMLMERSKAGTNDPWDAYVWLFAQHMMDEPTPLYFVLAAERSSAFDKNIPLHNKRMQLLVQAFSESRIGLHPSYFSDVRPSRLDTEKALLEQAARRSIVRSRQHFIKLRFPQTYRRLISAGIGDDYSMGYSTTFGFRAGTGTSFMWYDLEAEAVSSLRVHPFAFMDTTGRFDLALGAEEAFERLLRMTERLMAANSKLITVMHNFSLGSDLEWAGWRQQYEAFLTQVRGYATC